MMSWTLKNLRSLSMAALIHISFILVQSHTQLYIMATDFVFWNNPVN